MRRAFACVLFGSLFLAFSCSDDGSTSSSGSSGDAGEGSSGMPGEGGGPSLPGGGGSSEPMGGSDGVAAAGGQAPVGEAGSVSGGSPSTGDGGTAHGGAVGEAGAGGGSYDLDACRATESADACAAAGGEWRIAGPGLALLTCVCPTTDGGDACSEDNECDAGECEKTLQQCMNDQLGVCPSALPYEGCYCTPGGAVACP